MRLADLDPHWMSITPGAEEVVGLTFRCPHCPPGARGEVTYLGVMFTVPLRKDNEPSQSWPFYMAAHPDGHFWVRSGNTFDDLTLSPSVDASAAGHWHGFIRNGEVTS